MNECTKIFERKNINKQHLYSPDAFVQIIRMMILMGINVYNLSLPPFLFQILLRFLYAF